MNRKQNEVVRYVMIDEYNNLVDKYNELKEERNNLESKLFSYSSNPHHQFNRLVKSKQELYNDCKELIIKIKDELSRYLDNSMFQSYLTEFI